MERFHGLFGIALILGLAYLVSNNRKAINKRLVISGLLLQTTIALLVMTGLLGYAVAIRPLA